MLREKGEELPVFFDWSTDLRAYGLALNTSSAISLLCNVLVSGSEQKKKKKKYKGCFKNKQVNSCKCLEMSQTPNKQSVVAQSLSRVQLCD